MLGSERIIWEERAGMDDFKVYPIHWLFTILTFGIYFLKTYLTRLYTRYTLTNERLIKESGILKKDRDEIELFRVKDTVVHSGFFDRIVGYGDIKVVSSDVSGTFLMEKIPNAIKRREEIRLMANKAREVRGIMTVVNE